jgi:hypothetical protein
VNDHKQSNKKNEKERKQEHEKFCGERNLKFSISSPFVQNDFTQQLANFLRSPAAKVIKIFPTFGFERPINFISAGNYMKPCRQVVSFAANVAQRDSLVIWIEANSNYGETQFSTAMENYAK